MKTENIAPVFKTNLDTKSDRYQQNKKMMLEEINPKNKDQRAIGYSFNNINIK